VRYSYKPDNRVCPSNISFELRGGKIYGLEFEGGCDGNHKGLAALAEGADASGVIRMLDGIPCPYIKAETSCSDQLAQALRAAKLQAAIYGE
jgi:uncharacterized protein (TIGR03905 family)